MTFRSILLCSVALLLTGSIAKAAPSPEATASAPAPAACSSSLSPLEIAIFNPQPIAKALPCGACSDRWCQGSTVNSTCSYLGVGGYHAGHCQPLMGDHCSEDNHLNCSCGNSILP
jgi:hypothetical protein